MEVNGVVGMLIVNNPWFFCVSTCFLYAFGKTVPTLTAWLERKAKTWSLC